MIDIKGFDRSVCCAEHVAEVKRKKEQYSMLCLACSDFKEYWNEDDEWKSEDDMDNEYHECSETELMTTEKCMGEFDINRYIPCVCPCNTDTQNGDESFDPDGLPWWWKLPEENSMKRGGEN